ncbi:MAG: hypothetical protein GWO21_14280, partial [Gammaproteobacteria bacterium]|nr:hypothetical protein [Gammaproteobacteria bacterium]
EAEADALLVDRNPNGRWKLRAIRTKDGDELRARALVITTGTFLDALMHMGPEQVCGGRSG